MDIIIPLIMGTCQVTLGICNLVIALRLAGII